MAPIPAPEYLKTIVCLATSRKMSGRCIAGKEVSDSGYGPWLRPVSDRPDAEIVISHRQYQNGDEPKLLDIIQIPMNSAKPHGHQIENHLIDARFYWVKKGVVPWNDLAGLADTPPTLWTNDDSSKGGSNDRVSEANARRIKSSLILIKPEQVTIQVVTPGAYFNDFKRKIRANFYYKGIHYNFSMTDPAADAFYRAQENGDYKLKQDAYFCISLAETPYEGNFYKLVASIITKKPL
jgi:hypothetical protein